ncbi:hypothetical protein [Neobacillus cucumis]|uniref:hypothetical protein n=1 Tax=Neobacillus cucumis TaxID=1740721 RepID=UPI0019646504|nr:hypothetical protein [Neobacillus cucumis]MBM7656201.1 hypothetical protein [Neobacillus cucumis]
MKFYEKLPIEFLIRFYNEIKNNIENGILTKKMYYELGLIISVANRRCITLDLLADFDEEINEEVFKDFLQSHEVGCKCNPNIA